MVEWSIFNEIFAVAFNVLYFVIIIGTIFIVILDNRNPVKTMVNRIMNYWCLKAVIWRLRTG